MPESRVRETVPLPPEEAFDLFVNHIDTWWPRKGVFPYSFAPSSTLPLHIKFEPKLDGKFFEEFADCSTYEIGRITHWEPPRKLVYTWRDPSWEGDTYVTVSFEKSGEGTTVTNDQDGFAAAGAADMAPFYHVGNRQTLAAYFAHCRAVQELRALEGSGS